MTVSKNPVAVALGACLDCPSDHRLHRVAVSYVLARVAEHHYQSDAAEAIGVSPTYLSILMTKYPELKPFPSWASKRRPDKSCGCNLDSEVKRDISGNLAINVGICPDCANDLVAQTKMDPKS